MGCEEKENGQKSKYSEESYKKITKTKNEYTKDNYASKSLRLRNDEASAYKEAAVREREKRGLDTRQYSFSRWMNDCCKKLLVKGE